MKSYFSIVLFRFLEIVSRFLFLGQCLKLFSLEGYGEISYRIALYQFMASILYSGTLQSLCKYSISESLKQRSILTTLILIALGSTAIMLMVDGYASYIFLFYSLLYIQNGWYGTKDNQILFSSFRSLSFVGQALFFTFVTSNDLKNHVYISFGIASLLLLSCFPYRHLYFKFLPIKEWATFFKFQIHNMSFQFTKISERWALLFILDKKTFGLYSSIRDIINAANLTFFSPIYQTYYRKLSSGTTDHRRLLKVSFYVLLICLFSGLISIIISEDYFLFILERFGIAKFEISDFGAIIVLLTLDFYRSLQMMIIESKFKFKVLYQSHFLDFIILGLSTTLIFTNVLNYWRLFVVLFSRLLCINLFFTWKIKTDL